MEAPDGTAGLCRMNTNGKPCGNVEEVVVLTVMVQDPVFVTPHAVEQFQRRVAPWPGGAVIDWLLPRLQRLPDEVDVPMASLFYRVPFADRHITVVVGQ